jgi:hypothetical protein
VRSLRILLPSCLFLLAACHDSDGGGSGSVDFDALVTDLIQDQTSETGEPVEVEGTTFTFPQDENAFDDVLPPDTGAVVE